MKALATAAVSTIDDAPAPEPTRCPCGTAYAFLTPRCPGCGGDDPLASVVPGGLPSLHGEFEVRVALARTPATRTAPADELIRALRAHAELLLSTTAIDASRGEAEVAQQLLLDFEQRAAVRALGDDAARELETEIPRAASELLRLSATSTMIARQLWSPHATSGWRPAPQDERALHAALAATWQPAIDAVRRLETARTCAVESLRPVQRSLRTLAGASALTRLLSIPVAALSSDARMPGLVRRLGRPLLPFRSVGLVLRDARWLFRKPRQTLALEQFTDALTQLQAAATHAADALEHSVRQERAHAKQHAAGLAAFLCMTLAHDYGNAQPGGQQAIAVRIGKLLHRAVPSSRRRGSRPRIASLRALYPALLTRGALGLAVVATVVYWLQS